MSKENGTTDSTNDPITNTIDDKFAATTNISLGTIHFETISNGYVKCHGCSGKGWVENSKGDLKICPICEGEGKLNKEKDCVEKNKERNNLPWYPWYPCYPCPSKTNDPCWTTYPIITYCNVETDSDTNCSIHV